jgi:adenylate cyclase class 2
MKNEIEAKSIKIDKEEIRGKLKDLGCKRIFAEKLFKRKTYDLPSSSPFIDTSNIWIRLRTDGKDTDLTLKITSTDIGSVREVESKVDDFNIMSEFLQLSGFKQKSYQENYRERWSFGDVIFDIDTWPMIDPWLEIEAPTQEEVKEWFKKLKLDYNDAFIGSADVVYSGVYNIDILLLNTLTFNE